MSRLVLGGRFGEVPAALSFRLLDAFRAAGGSMVETAHVYAAGEAERVLGAWLRSRRCRDEMTVVDKVGHPRAGEASSLRPEMIRREVAGSLRRLGTDRIDVLLLHRDDPRQPIEQVLDTLVVLRTAGQVCRFGVSNWAAPRLAQLVTCARRRGERPLASYQFSLAVPVRPLWPGAYHASAGILGVVKAERLPLLSWSAQARGWFALSDGPPPPASNPLAAFDTAANREARIRCRALASAHGVAPATVALAWTLAQAHNGLDVYPVVGPERPAELAESLAAERLRLTPQETSWLSAAHGTTSIASQGIPDRADGDGGCS